MSGVKEPDLYKGIVTYVGMSDLERMRKDSDIANTVEGRSISAEFMGKDPALLKQQSPIHFVQQLKAPVFIVHGKADQRVPISQAEALRDALAKANRPYDWLVKNDEGHGFVRHAAKLELYERLIRFFDQHVKGSKS
jgi:acylaminoacyl-peptidase